MIVSGRWDEWVPPSRLLKMTEANLATQKTLQQKAQPETGHGSGAGAGRGAGRGAGLGGGGFGGQGSKEAATRGRKDVRGTKRGRDEVGRLNSFFVMLMKPFLFV
jgi:mortality factor 4-like protein 1